MTQTTTTTLGLQAPVRAGAMLIGLLCLGAGGWAVFHSANGAGTVALLVIAGLMLLLGVVGQVPHKFSAGSFAYDYHLADPELESSNAMAKEVAAERVLSAAAHVPDPNVRSVAKASEIRSHRFGVEAVSGVARSLGAEVYIEPPVDQGGDQLRPDIVVKPTADKQFREFPVEVIPTESSAATHAVALQMASLALYLGAPVAVIIGAQSSEPTTIGEVCVLFGSFENIPQVLAQAMELAA